MALSILQRQRFYSDGTFKVLSSKSLSNIDSMIENIFRLFERELRNKNLAFVIQVKDKKVQGKFLAEWDLYELTLFHLIKNAIKYSENRGYVSVILVLEEELGVFTVKTYVRNCGVGIKEA